MNGLQRAWRIALRELRGFFTSPVGWTILGMFFLAAGLVFVTLLFRYRQADLSLAQRPQIQPEQIGLHVNDWIVRPYLQSLGQVLLFFIPLLTMRSVAEERRSGSLDLLLSFPLRGSEIVLGKFIGASLSLLALFLIVPIHALVLGIVSSPDWSAALVGFVGVLLAGLFMTALGVLISSLSQSQVEAGVLTLGLLLLLGLGPGVAGALSPAVGKVIGFVAFLDRLEDFNRGVIALRHVAFYIGGTALWLGFALRSLDLIRWRGA